MLDISATTDLVRTLKIYADTLDSAALQECIFHHSSGLDYIAGYRFEPSQVSFSAGLAESILLLQSSYDYVILDYNASAPVGAREILAYSSAIIPMIEPDKACLAALANTMAWIDANGLRPKALGLVVNERSMQTGVFASLLAIESDLNTFATIPAVGAWLSLGANPGNPAALLAPTAPTLPIIQHMMEQISAAVIDNDPISPPQSPTAANTAVSASQDNTTPTAAQP